MRPIIWFKENTLIKNNKNICQFFKKSSSKDKNFLYGCYRTINYVQNIDNAAIIFRAILTIALSETEGTLANGEETPCEKEKKRLKSIVTG